MSCISLTGQVGYALAPMIAKGEMFGRHVPVHLHLFDIPSAENALLALKMELEDSAFPQLQGDRTDHCRYLQRTFRRLDGEHG